MSERICPLSAPDLGKMEVVNLRLPAKTSLFQEALALAREQADQRFEEYMLVSWFDRDRDIESPAHTSECAADGRKEGYIHYALSHGAQLKINIEEGRFIFFFAPVEW